MGVEMVESSSKQKATKNSMDRGVAGRSMVGSRCAVGLRENPARTRPARGCGGVERVSWALRSQAWESSNEAVLRAWC